MANTITSTKARYLEKTGTNTYEEKYFTTLVEQIHAEEAIAGQSAGADLVTILNGINTKAEQSGVTSITIGSGSAEKGDVSVTLAKLGTVAVTQAQLSQIEKNKNAVATAQSRADSAYVLAQGRSRGVSFETVEAMKTALKAASATEYKVGDQLFIKATNVPDYWVSEVLDTNTGETGYYGISIMETQKVDLSGYATTSSLNSVKSTAESALSTANSANTKANTNATDISNIKSGTTAVGKANQLATSRTFSITGDGTGSASFNGTANCAIALSLAATGVTAGTYSAVQVDTKGRVLKGQQMVVFATGIDDTALSSLAIGGIAVIDA